MDKLRLIIGAHGMAMLAFCAAAGAADGPDAVGLSNALVELSVQNQALKSEHAIITGEKEVLQTRLDACSVKLETSIRAQVQAQKEKGDCSAALEQAGHDLEYQAKSVAQLQDEIRGLEENNRLLIQGLEKKDEMTSVVARSSRTIMGVGEEKAQLIRENERLLRENKALELRAREAIRKAEAIVARKAVSFLRMVPCKTDIPAYVQGLKDDHDALKQRYAKAQAELNGLRRNIDRERASLYKEAGAAYVKEEFFTEAVGAYLKALKFDPRDPLTHYYLGVLYSKIGEQEQAAFYLRKYLKLDPKAGNRKEVLYLLSLIDPPKPQMIR